MQTATYNTAAYDEGMRKYFIGIYNRMTAGLLVTGLFAIFGTNFLQETIMSSVALMWLFALMPLAFVIVLMYGIQNLSVGVASTLFYAYAASVGLSFSTLTLMYEVETIFQAFFITAGTFAGASIYGYVTKADLTKMGSMLMMALIGLIIAMVVNIFMQSSVFAFFISAVAVLLFVVITAYDTQILKDEYYSNGKTFGFDSMERSAIFGALTLYLDFINIFIHILSLLGKKD